MSAKMRFYLIESPYGKPPVGFDNPLFATLADVENWINDNLVDENEVLSIEDVDDGDPATVFVIKGSGYTIEWIAIPKEVPIVVDL